MKLAFKLFILFTHLAIMGQESLSLTTNQIKNICKKQPRKFACIKELEDKKYNLQKGMYVGSHGSNHYWLDRISEKEQFDDISSSLEFLEEIGAPREDWIMCYPYGAYNFKTLCSCF